MPRPLHFVLNFAVRAALLAVIVVAGAYLLRRPLFESALRTRVVAELRAALGGEAELGAVGGDWLTTLRIEDLRLRTPGILREVDVATLHVDFDAFALARGDLAGLRRLRAELRTLAFDLEAPASNAPVAPDSGGGFDLGQLATLLPGGAQLDIAAFSLQGTAERLASPLQVLLTPRTTTTRRVYVEGCGARAVADLPSDGELRAVAYADLPLRAANLFAALPWLRDGRARAHASLRLAPAFTLAATAHAGALGVAEHPIESAFLHGAIDSDGLHDFAVDATTPGGTAAVRGFDLDFAAPTAMRARAVRVELTNFTPHAHLLPEGVPLTSAGLTAHADAGLLWLHSAAARAPGIAATVHSGAVELGSGTTRAPLRFTAIADVAAPTNLPIQVRRATARGEVDLRADGAAVRSQFGVELTDAAGRASVARGTATVAIGAQFAAEVQLDDAQARLADHDLALRGRARWRNGELTLTGLAVSDGAGNRAELDGTLGLAADLDWRGALRTRADLRARVVAPDLRAWLRTLAWPGAAASVAGELTWRTREHVAIDAQCTADITQLPAGGELVDARARLHLHADADGTAVRTAQLDLGPTRVLGKGGALGSPLGLLAPDATPALFAAGTPLDLTLQLDDLALATLPLNALGLAELRGRLGATVRVAGSIAAPELSGQVEVSGVGLRTQSGERLDDLRGRVELTPQTARLVDVHASRGTGPLELDGELRATGPLWSDLADADLVLNLRGRDVLLHRQAGLKVRADLDLAVRGKPRDFTVSGTVAVHDSKLVNRLPLFDLRRTGGAAATTGIHLPGVTLPAPWRGRLDIGIATSEPFAVETNLLTGKLDAQLRLRGDLAQPSLLGTIASDDATVILPGARLRASALLLEFRADAPTLPRLTASARGRRHGFDILVNAQGRYDRPDIVFSSEPPLPSDELLVLVTTGARPSGLRDVRGVGAVLGTYVAQEFADWIFGSESTEAKDSFLDRFTVETGTEMSRGGSESIVVEFRIGERVYLQGERDVYSDINMGLVYRLRFR